MAVIRFRAREWGMVGEGRWKREREKEGGAGVGGNMEDVLYRIVYLVGLLHV